MFWKTALTRPSNWSIGFRLACIYTFSAFALLTLGVLALYWIFTVRLERDNALFLSDKALVIKKILQIQPLTSPLLRAEIFLEPKIYHYYARILDTNGNIVLVTPGMDALAPMSAFNMLAPDDADSIQTTRKTYHLLVTAVVNQPNTNVVHYNIQLAMDITPERHIVADYQHYLMLVLLIGILASAAVGSIVTRRGLRPLRDITRSTRRITVSHLEERLDPSALPQEIAVLAFSFNNMLDRIQEGFLRLSQFSADLAHELRTPINNLIGEAEIALSRPRTGDEYRQVLESSLEEFQRLAHMIENLLFLARAENPRAAVQFSNVEVKQMLEDITDFYAAAVEERNITIECNVKEPIYIQADALMVRRAVSNLISNALQHTLAGGTIKLTVEADQTVKIHVSDTGIGIPAEHLPHLFDRFYRVDSARSQSTGGTGLGLAIVKSIMDLHHGQVLVNSEVNQGTTVTLAFPI